MKLIIFFLVNSVYAIYGHFIEGKFALRLYSDFSDDERVSPMKSSDFDKNVFVYKVLCVDLELFDDNCKQNLQSLVEEKTWFDFPDIKQLTSFFYHSLLFSDIHSISYHTIKYTSPGYHTQTEQHLSGILILPKTENIKGVILYYHSTLDSNSSSPSIKIPSQYTESENFNLIYTMFASNGYIVIIPDYIGFGTNSLVMHPYVFGARENALSGIYMLQAVRQYLKDTLSIDISNQKLFISGYSEGAGYALKSTELLDTEFAYILTDLHLTLQKTFAGNGIYSYEDTQNFMVADIQIHQNEDNLWHTVPLCISEPHLCKNPKESDGIGEAKSDLSFYRLYYSLYFFTSLASYHDQYNLKKLLKKDVYNLKNCLYIIGASVRAESCKGHYLKIKNFDELIKTSLYPISTFIFLVRPVIRYTGYEYGHSRKFIELQRELYSTPNTYTSILHFVNKNFLEDQEFIQYLKNEIDTFNLSIQTPVEILYTQYDSQVPNVNSEHACSHYDGLPAHTKSPGLIKCLQLNNKKFWSSITRYNTTYLQHSDTEGIFAVHEIQTMNKITSK